MVESFYTVPGCPCRIALVADLHEKPWGAVLDSLRARRPALVCVAGDFVYGDEVWDMLKVEKAGVLPFFKACAELAPCFVSLGNHEWMLTEDDLRRIEETGARVVDNAFARCELAGAELVVGGLSSGYLSAHRRLGTHPNRSRAYTRSEPLTAWLDDFCREPGYRVLLCHHPEYYPRYLRGRDIPLILSGHAHGGQVRVFGQGLFAPGQGLFPRLTDGVRDNRLVISRGLANCARAPRLFNPTELVYVEGE